MASGSVLAIVHDALHGLRSGRGTTMLAFAILTLALSAGTVTFSVVDAVALRPLPYAAPEQLLGISAPGVRPGTLSPVSPQDYFSWVEGTQAFTSLAASRPTTPLRLEAASGAETLVTRRVTANLFDVLGVRPAVGRFFGPEHEHSGGPGAVILSYDVWARKFRSDASVIGRTLQFGQDALEVVGVLPPGVWYPMELSPADLYLPYIATIADRSNSRGRSMSVVGRLRPGVTMEQAQADVARVAASPLVVLRLRDQVAGSTSTWLFLVLAAVGFVILIACVNVATLLLARAATRAPEFATREALGASRGRLAAGLVLEGLILAVSAALAAIVVSAWSVDVVRSNMPSGLLTRVSTIAVDGRVLSVSIAAAVLCGVVCASAPTWLASRSELTVVMNASGGPILGDHGVHRSLAAFLAAEITAVCILLVATTLSVRTFIRITAADLGFDRENVFTIQYERVLKDGSDAARPVAAEVFRAELLARATSVPGVSGAAIATNGSVPLSGGSVRYSLVIPGMGETRNDDVLETRMVTPDYFRVMGMRLIRGRLFDPRDRAGAPLVMLINDVAARRFFQGRDPIGQVVTFRGPTTIVGVLNGVHFSGPEADVRPEMYTPADQERARGGNDSGSLVVRTSRNPREVAAAVRDAIRPALGSAQPGQTQFVDEFFRRLTAGRRFNAGVMAVLGFVAVALGLIGVYGTTEFLVTRRVREIGLRLALGASRPRIMGTVLASALRVVVFGAALGLGGAWVTSNAFRGLVFDIRPTDPVVYAAVAGLVTLIAIVAAIGPAMRAARLDPMDALRRD